MQHWMRAEQPHEWGLCVTVPEGRSITFVSLRSLWGSLGSLSIAPLGAGIVSGPGRGGWDAKVNPCFLLEVLLVFPAEGPDPSDVGSS